MVQISDFINNYSRTFKNHDLIITKINTSFRKLIECVPYRYTFDYKESIVEQSNIHKSCYELHKYIVEKFILAYNQMLTLLIEENLYEETKWIFDTHNLAGEICNDVEAMMQYRFLSDLKMKDYEAMQFIEAIEYEKYFEDLENSLKEINHKFPVKLMYPLEWYNNSLMVGLTEYNSEYNMRFDYSWLLEIEEKIRTIKD